MLGGHQGSPKCGSGNKPLDKKAAMAILEILLGHIPLSELLEKGGRPEPQIPELVEQVMEPVQEGPRVVYLDIETKKSAEEVGGWQNTHLMGVSVAVIFDSLEDRFITFFEENIEGLFTHLGKADLVVGFNIKQFDYKVLGAYTSTDLGNLPTFDILEDIYHRLGFRLGLDHLASETLKQGKTADGLQALEWFKQGEIDKVVEYCSQDVAITRDLFQFGLQNGHLIYKGKRANCKMRLRVDWRLDKLIEGKGKGVQG
ncbi:MAG: ribonuclease H-like domain-containing protein [Deltaproteobacteria bacterium]|nr:ribonuclease H-like domain-containing protein [Deltaproteobacteria bacterium]MBW2302004.1 ribonuclease H-like domain-containing protein [Deltaproteobacteria bacterium]